MANTRGFFFETSPLKFTLFRRKKGGVIRKGRLIEKGFYLTNQLSYGAFNRKGCLLRRGRLIDHLSYSEYNFKTELYFFNANDVTDRCFLLFNNTDTRCFFPNRLYVATKGITIIFLCAQSNIKPRGHETIFSGDSNTLNFVTIA